MKKTEEMHKILNVANITFGVMIMCFWSSLFLLYKIFACEACTQTTPGAHARIHHLFAYPRTWRWGEWKTNDLTHFAVQFRKSLTIALIHTYIHIYCMHTHKFVVHRADVSAMVAMVAMVATSYIRMHCSWLYDCCGCVVVAVGIVGAK